jgi:hypothetical protein
MWFLGTRVTDDYLYLVLPGKIHTSKFLKIGHMQTFLKSTLLVNGSFITSYLVHIASVLHMCSLIVQRNNFGNAI